MSEETVKAEPLDVLTHAANIVAAYVTKNAIPASELPMLIADIHGKLNQLASGAVESPDAEPKEPAVPIKKSISNEFIVCLEDGQKFQSMRRHLSAKYDLTPEAYRKKWGLPPDYPMVAPAYAAVRSETAKKAGFGLRGVAARATKKKPAKAA